eukprot:CAMPEP_0177779328 /NCGR_PEP_ID=MMETSP0491_2-20121128/16520_1 /TAXON_ID=63592 /ORGANISM="Tetraselmis chuii, Strain PLY429" /LENGTH=48 /DNA_ID= /DNA_START= /DNA_END= /DNA_ORIENTATION=
MHPPVVVYNDKGPPIRILDRCVVAIALSTTTPEAFPSRMGTDEGRGWG